MPARRHSSIDLHVMAVERGERRLQLRAAACADRGRRPWPRPSWAAPWRRGATGRGTSACRAGGQVVGDRHARQLDDAALDRVHQVEVADRPRGTACPRDSPSRAGRTAWRRGRRRARTPTLRFSASMPEIQRRAASLFSLASSRSSARHLLVGVADLLAVAVVGLVVDDDDVLHPQQLAAGLAAASRPRSAGVGRRPVALQERAPDLGDLHRLARRKAW